MAPTAPSVDILVPNTTATLAGVSVVADDAMPYFAPARLTVDRAGHPVVVVPDLLKFETDRYVSNLISEVLIRARQVGEYGP